MMSKITTVNVQTHLYNIDCQDLGKRYNREWIFRHFNYQFQSGKTYAITGANGAGKSTLLQVIAGATLHSEGKIIYTNNEIVQENIYRDMAIAAPYLELIEEMTTLEFLQFHRQFKPLTLSSEAVLEAVNLSSARDKQIRYFSSGMKQRLKLGQAFFSDTSVLMLDEPTTNLDAAGTEMYLSLLDAHSARKLVIISSNDSREYACCDAIINMADYKV